jgi:NitT/TauT family transport system substrate-binding protein
MKLTGRYVQRLVTVLTMGLMLSSPAFADQLIRFAYVKTSTLVPFFYAKDRGYFKQQGIDVEMIPVQGGPAVASAIAGGSADIGYAAVAPIAMAAAQGQHYRFFIALEQERQPSRIWGHIIASKKSGVTTIADLRGKTVTVGPPGGLCELMVRDWLSHTGLKWSDIKPLYLPFPQIEAALQVGNADAACIFDPFYTAAMNSAANPVELAGGYLAQQTEPYSLDGLFADQNWISANSDKIGGLKRAVEQAWKELAADPELLKKILREQFRFPPALIEKLRLDYNTDVAASPKLMQPVIAAMQRVGMLPNSVTANDIVARQE